MAQPCLRYRNRRLASPKETLLLTKECDFEGVFLLPLSSNVVFILFNINDLYSLDSACSAARRLYSCD